MMTIFFTEGAKHTLTVGTIGIDASHQANIPEMSNVQYFQVRAICKERNKIRNNKPKQQKAR